MVTKQNAELAKRIGQYLVLNPQKTLSPAVFVALVIVLECWVKIFNVPSIIFAAPSAIFFAFIRGFQQGIFIKNLLYTLVSALLGFGIAVFLGVLVGFVLAQFRLIKTIFYPYILGFQTMPRIAIAPLFIIWFGFGISSKVAIAATIAFFPVMINVQAGLQSVNPQMLNLMRSLAANRWQIFRLVTLPNSLPYVFAGLQIALVFSLLGAIVGEFIGSEYGLGVLLVQMNSNMDIAGVFSVLIVLMLVGLTMNHFLKWLQRRLLFWALPQDVQET